MKTHHLKMKLLLKPLAFVFLIAIITSCSQGVKVDKQADNNTPEFKGKIALDVRDSESDWTPYTPKSAPEGAPNVLFILYDDTGLGAWSPYGGAINMPTLDKLAANCKYRIKRTTFSGVM